MFAIFLAGILPLSFSAKITLFLEDQKQEHFADILVIKYLVQKKELTLVAGMQPTQSLLESSLAALKSHGIKKSNIKVSNYKIKPVYKAIRDHTKFYGFFVSYEVEVIVQKPQIVGKVVDSLVSSNVHQIQEISWEEAELQQEDQNQGLVKKAIRIGNKMCNSFGEEFSEVELVEPVQEEEVEDQQEQEQQQQEEEEEQQSPLKYKIVLNCNKKKK